MIYIYVIIIIIILAIDIYFKFTDPSETMININEDKNMIKFDEPNPWTQIYVGNNINKYYVKINNIEKYKENINIDMWDYIPFIRKDLIKNEDGMLTITTNNEKEALVVTNVLLSYILGDLTLENIIEKDLINISLQKAQRYELVVNKLRELIKENLYKINRDDTIEKYINKNISYDTALMAPSKTPSKAHNNLENSIDYSSKKKKKKDGFVNKITEPEIVTQATPVIEPTLPFFNVMPYEGSEFASVTF